MMDRVAERWNHSEARRRLQALEQSLQEQYQRVRLLRLQTTAA